MGKMIIRFRVKDFQPCYYVLNLHLINMLKLINNKEETIWQFEIFFET